MSTHSNERCVAIIQARVGSARLPGKVLLPLEGKSVLERLVERVRLARQVHEIWVATSVDPRNRAIVELGQRAGFHVYVAQVRENDVLGRYTELTEHLKASVVVRVTADNPFTDPWSMDKMITTYLDQALDYVYSDHPTGLPSGFSSEVISRDALLRCHTRATSDYHREHVTTYILDHPGEFRMLAWEPSQELHRREVLITIDTEADLEQAQEVCRRLGDRTSFARPEEILSLFDNQGKLG